MARANTPATGIPIAWLQGDLCALPFPPSSVDVVLCNQGLQYAQDTLAALAEAVLERTAQPSYSPYMTKIHEDARRPLGQEVCAALQAYRDSDDFVIPYRNRLVHTWVA